MVARRRPDVMPESSTAQGIAICSRRTSVTSVGSPDATLIGPAKRTRATGGAMPNPVVHFEVLGKDAQALQSFYGQVFDWELNSVMPTYAMVSTGIEGGIPGGVGATPDGSDGHVIFYVAVDDLAA